MIKKVICGVLAVALCIIVGGCSYFEDYEPMAREETSGLMETDEVTDGSTLQSGTGETTGTTVSEHNAKDTEVGTATTRTVPKNTTRTNNSTTAVPKTSRNTTANKSSRATTASKTSRSTTVDAGAHVGLKPLSGYQYSRLDATEKMAYNALVAAADGLENVVDVSACGLKTEDAQKVFECFFADNPQYFYLSRRLHYFYMNGVVVRYCLFYTDGKVTDEFNDDFQSLKVKANRSTIRSMMSKLERRVNRILSTIPVNATASEKERLIHDYIVDNVAYDTSVSLDNISAQDTLPHSFDLYGAVCEGKAVCEGFAKMFQYLCGRVGIQATVVQGDANGAHMWNAVRIGKAWYHVDVTWDDNYSVISRSYKFYNVTTKDLKKTHKIIKSSLYVPDCR